MAGETTKPSVDATPLQEGRVIYEVKLDEKHNKDGKKQSEAYRVGSQMQKVLASPNYFPPNEVTLKLTVSSISKGSRWGRICCGECGVGWAVLKTEWCLTRNGKNLTSPKTETTRDSGAIGTKDGDPNFSEKQIVDDLAHAAANRIGAKAKAAVLQIEK